MSANIETSEGILNVRLTEIPFNGVIEIDGEEYEITVYKRNFTGKITTLEPQRDTAQKVGEVAKECFKKHPSLDQLKFNFTLGKVYSIERGKETLMPVPPKVYDALKDIESSITQLPATPKLEDSDKQDKEVKNGLPKRLKMDNYIRHHEEGLQTVAKRKVHNDSKTQKEFYQEHLAYLTAVDQDFELYSALHDGNCAFDSVGIAFAHFLNSLQDEDRKQRLATIDQTIETLQIPPEKLAPFEDLRKALINKDYKYLMEKHRDDLRKFFRFLACEYLRYKLITADDGSLQATRTEILHQAQIEHPKDDNTQEYIKLIKQYITKMEKDTWGSPIETNAIAAIIDLDINLLDGSVAYERPENCLSILAVPGYFDPLLPKQRPMHIEETQ